MIHRSVTTNAVYLLKNFPSLAILGARQVGKTTLSKSISAALKKPYIYFDLENDKDLFRFELDAQGLLEQHSDKLVVIDEIQRLPRLFALLRSLIDQKRKPGRFLLLGSASPVLLHGVTESLAGRISYIDLGPLSWSEIAAKKIPQNRHWFRGGYPKALLAKTDKLALQWLNDYIKSYVQRDLSQIYSVQFPAGLVQSFWQMLASSNGAVWNAESYARALGVSAPTVVKYLNFLEGAFLIYRLDPWFFNAKKRVIKSPKIYISDTGILHALNHINSWNELNRNVIIGSSWEAYAIQQIRQEINKNIRLFFYRTQNGAECDLVFVKQNKPIAICEIKLSETPSVTRGFYECLSDLKCDKNFVITSGNNLIKDKKKKITYCGLTHFLEKILPTIK